MELQFISLQSSCSDYNTAPVCSGITLGVEDSIPSKERKWDDILANRNLKGKLVMKLVRHHDQDERETDGSFHWKSMGPKLRFAFHK